MTLAREGRAPSPFNTCLVLNQLLTASKVGGFRQWKDKGRSVKKGEHGLMIWVPTGKGEKTDDGETVPVPETEAGADGEKPKRAGFIMGTVFDVSQTEPSRDHSGDRQRMDELAQDMADVNSL